MSWRIGVRPSGDHLGGRTSKTNPQLYIEIKFRVVGAGIAVKRSLKVRTTKAGVEHSLVHYRVMKYQSRVLPRAEEGVEMALYIAANGRKVGQLEWS